MADNSNLKLRGSKSDQHSTRPQLSETRSLIPSNSQSLTTPMNLYTRLSSAAVSGPLQAHQNDSPITPSISLYFHPWCIQATPLLSLVTKLKSVAPPLSPRRKFATTMSTFTLVRFIESTITRRNYWVLRGKIFSGDKYLII